MIAWLLTVIQKWRLLHATRFHIILLILRGHHYGTPQCHQAPRRHLLPLPCLTYHRRTSLPCLHTVSLPPQCPHTSQALHIAILFPQCPHTAQAPPCHHHGNVPFHTLTVLFLFTFTNLCLSTCRQRSHHPRRRHRLLRSLSSSPEDQSTTHHHLPMLSSTLKCRVQQALAILRPMFNNKLHAFDVLKKSFPCLLEWTQTFIHCISYFLFTQKNYITVNLMNMIIIIVSLFVVEISVVLFFSSDLKPYNRSLYIRFCFVTG